MKQLDYNKYALYERAVQSPEVHVQWFEDFYTKLNKGKSPVSLREDFSGTFLISCEWIQQNETNTALAVDLDPEPLNYGNKNHRPNLDKQ